jgi:hypothetical protein
MKKLIYIFLFSSITFTAASQVWVEGFALHSSPMKDWMAQGNRVINIEGYDPITVANSDLFTTFADPQFGGGLNLRYIKNKLVIGLEIGYVEYKPATILANASMFRLGPIIEYHFFNSRKIHPYVGGEWGLQSSTITYNGEIINAPKLAETHMGVGPRAGFVYVFGPKWAFRAGAKYMYLKKLPYLDITAGIAFNIGDF